MTLNRQNILDFFPALNEVMNKEWVDTACDIWLEAFEKSDWKDVQDAQFAMRAPNVPLVQHTNSVVDNALKIAKRTIAEYNYPLDLDILIISGVLHDVCKLEEMTYGEGGVGTSKKSDIGAIYQHGFLSGFYAQQYNLPKEVVAFCVSHAGQSKLLPKTKEELILFYCDVMDADLHFMEANVPLTLEVD